MEECMLEMFICHCNELLHEGWDVTVLYTTSGVRFESANMSGTHLHNNICTWYVLKFSFIVKYLSPKWSACSHVYKDLRFNKTSKETLSKCSVGKYCFLQVTYSCLQLHKICRAFRDRGVEEGKLEGGKSVITACDCQHVPLLSIVRFPSNEMHD